MQGVNSRLGEIDIWRKSVDTQIGQLAARIPRQSGALPGSSEPNPKGKTGHVAAVKLRSGHQLQEPEVGKQ